MTIKAIYGQEPMREGEYPTLYMVGFPVGDPITRIERRDEGFGDHGLAWFDVFKGDRKIASANLRYVAFVDHFEGDVPTPPDHEIVGLALSLVQDLVGASEERAAALPTSTEPGAVTAWDSFTRLRNALDKRYPAHPPV